MSNRNGRAPGALGVAARLSASKLALTLSMLVGATMIVPTQASAQLFFSRRLPPAQIIGIVQSRGYTTPSYPYFRGDIYVVDANEPRGSRVRLVIDPASGEIVERLFIRQQRVIPAPGFDDGYGRSVRLVNPSEEAAAGAKTEQPRRKRTAKRPVEPVPQTVAPVETPAAPEAAAPQDTAPPASIARPTSPATASAPTSPSPPTPPAPPLASGEARGTKANPRKVGPVVPSPVGVE